MFFLKKRILFYGHNGWIGGMFIEYLKCLEKNHNLKIIKGNARLENINEIKHEIKKINPILLFLLLEEHME